MNRCDDRLNSPSVAPSRDGTAGPSDRSQASATISVDGRKDRSETGGREFSSGGGIGGENHSGIRDDIDRKRSTLTGGNLRLGQQIQNDRIGINTSVDAQKATTGAEAERRSDQNVLAGATRAARDHIQREGTNPIDGINELADIIEGKKK